ncbi:MAG: YggS family pyridoxal phosphate-dependent enzyme [Lachnospiraceae bacterium]|nr:YggS family pyridoxal phosphate-dependent enzyme [Lachnospiraceae bacterium]MDE6699067.1 YggS family pyridoxal phosphate-dependent enzyme [Lachnospiraceae bacterium]
MITDNYKDVLLSVEAKEETSKYNQSVTLIAVSKTKPMSDIEELYHIGVRDFGENKVQELCEKYENLPKDIRWHLIGHLQTNKVKYIVDKVSLIHSVDSVHLANQIERECIKKNVEADILVQVNVAEEDTKYGLKVEETISMVKEIAALPHVHIKGLMTIAPFVDNPEDNREVFKALKKLSVDINDKNIDNVCMDILSMGMSGDYEIAIEEGSTMVRVGTSIFGERNYNR